MSISAGAASSRAFPMRTSTSRRGRSLSGRFGSRASASVEEAVARVRDGLGSVREGGWLRGRGWRDAGWPTPPTKEALDEVAGDVPVALLAHDSHSLWLNSAALARADGDLDVDGGVVERDAARRADGRSPRGGVLAVPRSAHPHPGRGVPRSDARGPARGGDHEASRPSTTRTAGSARSGSGSRSLPTARSRSGSGSRCPPITSTSWPGSGCAAASATGCSGSAT